MKRHLLVSIYSHPESYPPTLNALTLLAPFFEKVTLQFRPQKPVLWQYAPNVRLLPSGKAMPVGEQQRLGFLKKMMLLGAYVRDMARVLRREKPEVVLLYDPLALLAFALAHPFAGGSRPLLWYHNHDVFEPNQPKFSIQWLALRAERRLFPRLDAFSLPAMERRACFPTHLFRGKFFFLPNLPALSLYRQFFNQKKPAGEFRLIYQGAVDEGHGIEEIVGMMPFEVRGKPAKLVLKGWPAKAYEDKVRGLAQARGAGGQVEFVSYSAYQDLPRLTSSCHAGIAIHTKGDLMNKTLGTASNKIYEYAASGLPVLFFDNPHFREHLGGFEWAFPTNLSEASLKGCFEKMADNHEALSAAARRDFEGGLNFERHFQPVVDFLLGKPAAGDSRAKQEGEAAAALQSEPLALPRSAA